jgi:hypothetical protein
MTRLQCMPQRQLARGCGQQRQETVDFLRVELLGIGQLPQDGPELGFEFGETACQKALQGSTGAP